MASPSILVTRKLPASALAILRDAGEVEVAAAPLDASALREHVRGRDGLVCLLTDRVDRELLRPEVGDDEVRAIMLATSPSIGFYGGAIALAIVAPRAAAVGYLLIAVLGVVRVRGDQNVAEPA